MKSRELGIVLFGLAGLYTLLLAILGLAQLLPQVQTAGAVVGGQLRLQAAFVNGLTSVLLHMVFGIALFAGRRRLADRLLGADEPPRRTPPPPPPLPPVTAGAGRSTLAGASASALAIAAAGVCAVAILLVARAVTAASYAISLLVVHDNTGDIAGWTIGGILVDLLMTAAGLLLVARRTRIAARLFGVPPAAAGAGTAASGEDAWQLPAMRFLGLALLVWHLPSLASALSVFLKWWLRPEGFDLRSQALYDLPPAATGVLAGTYFFLLFPAGLGGAWRRLRP
jgi:hypothetical protein